MDDLQLHQHLIGRQGSRADLNTPVLILDLDALDRNIGTMQALVNHHGIALRPHAKTHKSVDIARRQIAAGAVGLCCAKIGEAEVLADGGINGLLITSPVASPPAIERLAALAAPCAVGRGLIAAEKGKAGRYSPAPELCSCDGAAARPGDHPFSAIPITQRARVHCSSEATVESPRLRLRLRLP